jgi:hypothetical protein
MRSGARNGFAALETLKSGIASRAKTLSQDTKGNWKFKWPLDLRREGDQKQTLAPCRGRLVLYVVKAYR